MSISHSAMILFCLSTNELWNVYIYHYSVIILQLILIYAQLILLIHIKTAINENVNKLYNKLYDLYVWVCARARARVCVCV